MIVSKVQNQPKQNKVVVIPPQASPVTAPLIAASEPHDSASQRRIRERAFEFFKERGSKPGHDMQDWLAAERQILAQ